MFKTCIHISNDLYVKLFQKPVEFTQYKSAIGIIETHELYYSLLKFSVTNTVSK